MKNSIIPAAIMIALSIWSVASGIPSQLSFVKGIVVGATIVILFVEIKDRLIRGGRKREL